MDHRADYFGLDLEIEMTLRIKDLELITLSRGAHKNADAGHCLLEVVSMFAGEEFGDSPECVDPILAAFGRAWNDGMRSDAERLQLKQYITRLPGTNKTSALSQKRGWMAMDWIVRTYCATWLALNPGLAHHAETLRALPQVTCTAELVAAQPKLDAARKDAAAAWDAAWAAAWAAAGDAAWDAAWDAAGDAAWAAARDAAWDAAWAAARDAAGDAAGAAAGAKLEPTVKELQASAHALFSAMIDAEE